MFPMGFKFVFIANLIQMDYYRRQKTATSAGFWAYLALSFILTGCGSSHFENLPVQVVTTTTYQMPDSIEVGPQEANTTTTTTTIQSSPALPQAPQVSAEAQKQNTQAKGFYTKGELIHGMNLMEGAGKSIHKLLMDRKRYYGTSELVSLIQEMAQFVSEKLAPGQPLQIGDLSKKNGGKLAEHESHQNGLDVDIVYLSKNGQLQAQKESYWTEWFVDNGNFDIEKNWELVKWISKKSNVQRIFVDGAVKQALCKQAHKRGELKSHVRALSLLRPENAVHKTHFHLRLACPVDDKACVSQESASQESGCQLPDQDQKQKWPESLALMTKQLLRMEMKQNCHSTVIEGMNMLDCQYRTGGPGQTVNGRVVLMDVTQDMWMNWIGNACQKLTHVDSESCYKTVIDRILQQSGGQIPWRGNVYEDQTPTDGKFEAYCFRDGIGIGVTGLDRWMARDVTPEESRLCLESQDVIRVGLYPRPIGLSVDEYARSSRGKAINAYLNPDGKGNKAWLEEVRKTLKEAYHSDENFFITEWARLNVR